MEEKNNQQGKVIDLGIIARLLWSRKRKFYKVWTLTFVLSCIWILPQPRYYCADVMLAPEVGSEDVGGGFSSLASSFGLNLGGLSGQDAIYPELYPSLFENPEFMVGLYDVQVTTEKGDFSADYFTYMKSHQKKNYLLLPFTKAMKFMKELFEKEDGTPRASNANDINPFRMNKKDYLLMQKIMKNITCSVDKRTRVVTVKVKDQDPLISATMANSVKTHLQNFIIRYRTSKVSEDVAHYQKMRDSLEREFNIAMDVYSRYCDTHKNISLQVYQSERDKLESELAIKQNALTAMETQLQATKVKLQEKTPAFTTLRSATVPIKPAGPKRMIFVAAMLFLSTLITSIVICRHYILEFL